ncbi:glutathione S-transferase [Alphaproteobacteria bacterium]|nr:glutathione S-transferase [Alphaproteobacteria bacterium]GHS98736.1 glutathione S-transferase [Alphaproteobacteria bacterium]
MRKLYYYPLCAFSRTALLVLSEKKLDFITEVTRFWDQKGPILDLNSFGRLPVFVDLNGSVIAGVYAVCEYLEEAYEDFKILGTDWKERAEARRIFQWLHEDFAADITAPLVYEKDIKRYFTQGPASAPSSAKLKNIKDILADDMKHIESFAERRNWLAGDNFSLADLAAAAHISIADYLGGISWKQFPTAKEWYMRIKSRPSFKRLLADRVPGLPASAHYTNLDF